LDRLATTFHPFAPDAYDARRSMARLLTATLPRVEVMTVEQLGHMGPVTHSDAVNATIEQFLARHG
jgi:pimeloyl-ACP methyl ester carboxylesterase